MNRLRTVLAVLALTTLAFADAGVACAPAGQVAAVDRSAAEHTAGEHSAAERPAVELPTTGLLEDSAQPQGSGSGEAAAPQHAPQRSTRDMELSEPFLMMYSHLVPHPLGEVHGEPGPFTFYNVNLFQLIVLGLLLVIFGAVLVSLGRPIVPGRRPAWFMRVMRGWVRWIRDEMVYPVMGEDEGRRFTPFFLYLFFFIALMNLVGLVPSSVTATASVFVTGALAIVVFVLMVVGGMMQQGVAAFWKNLLPHGLPFWLMPLMFVLELIALFVKPFALTIRLFANMLAGHLVIYSFIGMIFVAAKMLQMSGWTWLITPLPVGMGVFIMIIEAFVALLQAYIFTYLSVIFVQQSLHPAH